MALTLPPEMRTRVRVELGRALSRVPVDWTERARHSPAGRPLARVLRHRPLGDVDSFTLPDDPRVRLAGTDSLMVRRLYWYGGSGYEGAELHWWKHFCGRATRIVEMGANVGYYTVEAALAAPTATVTAVEANPESAAVVRRNLELNGITNVEVVEAAVMGVKTADTIELLLPDAEAYEAPTGAYVGSGEVAGRPASRSVTVPVVEASALVEGADLLKLDIEGLEADVLGGAETAIAAQRPVIFLEVIRSAEQLRALIAGWHERHGYAVFAIGDTSLHLLTRADLSSGEPLPRFGTRDVILVPQERVTDC